MGFLRKSLMARLVFYFLLLSVFTVALVASVAYDRASRTLTQSLLERLTAVSTLKQGELTDWIQQQKRTVGLLARSPEVQQQTTLLLNGTEAEKTAAYQHLTELFQTTLDYQPDLQEIFILTDVGGLVVISTNKNSEQQYHTTDTYFVRGRLSPYLQNVYPSPMTGKPAMTFAVPLLNETQNQRLGVLAVHLSLAEMDAIILERTGLGETGETYLVDELNLFVSSQRFGRENFPHGVHTVGIDAAVSGISGSGLYTNYQGVPVIGVYRHLEDQNLALLAEMSQAEAFAPAQVLATTILRVGFLSVAILTVGIYVLSWQITRPILAITETAVKATNGDFSHPVPIMTEDEISLLAHSFNTMQANLVTSRQQIEEYTQTLEERVRTRTHDLYEANQMLARRAVLLETNSQVAQHITSILNLQELLQVVVDLLHARFGYYFVGIWLTDEDAQTITLLAGGGGIGEELQGMQLSLAESSIVGWVCKIGRSRLVDDVTAVSDYKFLPQLPKVRSELVLPLRIGTKIIGALDLESNKLDAFSGDDRIMMQTLADEIAIATRNAQLYASEQERRQLAESLEEIGRILSSTLELSEVPQRILNQLHSVVPYARGSVLLQEGDVLQIIASRGFPESHSQQVVPMQSNEHDVYHRLVQSGEPLMLNDVTKDPGWQQMAGLEWHYSWIGIPLIARDHVIGMLSITRKEPAAFSANDLTVVAAFASQAAIALENARLYDQITHFTEQLEKRVEERTEELNTTYRVLERLDKTKSDFISITSHELRTPLSLIKGYAQILDDEIRAGRSENLAMMLSGVQSGVERLESIVNKMLDVAKIDTLSLESYQEFVVPFTIIDNVYFTYEKALQERGLQFSIRGIAELPMIQADPSLLLKVFEHLIVNAIKYTPDNGSIQVIGKTVQEGERKMIEILIQDTGIGIDPEHHELIFEKFYQTGEIALHSSGDTKFKGGGPGVGLAIVKGIVDAHGGRVWVESEGYNEELCPGSRFYVRLPLTGKETL